MFFLEALKCRKTIKNVENQIKEMMDLIKSTPVSQIKEELLLEDLQESVDFTIANMMNTKKANKEGKVCLLENKWMQPIK